jgi:hypothetical protein
VTRKIKALSVRQPWAWLIVNNYKSVENRSRFIEHYGELLIHASQTMTKADYEACVLFLRADERLRRLVEKLPKFEELERGGFVGIVTVFAIARGLSQENVNPWYTGEVGYFLGNAKVLPFKPYKGRLGFFEVEL